MRCLRSLLSLSADCDESSADVQDGEGDDDMVDKPPPPFKPLNPHNFYWYAGLRCVDEFQKLHGKFPGLDDASWEREAEELKGIIKQFVDKRGIYVSERDNERDILSKIAVELSRYGGCEPHVTAAFMGGMGAQVALKLVLKQYVPINNSLIYNGIHCSATTMQL
jgi:amyloid beta precursor protein binding protein 1